MARRISDPLGAAKIKGLFEPTSHVGGTDADLKAKAQEHCAKRNNFVVEVLCFVSLLRNAGLVPDGRSAKVKPAKFQDVKASAIELSYGVGQSKVLLKLKMESAHCLPCHINIGRGDICNWPKNQATKMRLLGLFKETTKLPAYFNDADQAAEDAGLRDALAAACQKVLDESKNPAGAAAGVSVDRQVVFKAYVDWCRAAFDAYRGAIQQKEATLDVVANPLEAEPSNRLEEIKVLRAYREFTDQTKPDALGEFEVGRLEQNYPVK